MKQEYICGIKDKVNVMKELIKNKIIEYVKGYPELKNVKNIWREPVVGFADAKGTYIKSLKTVVSAEHKQPEDFMENPSIVISYFIPFTQELAAINMNVEGNMAAQEWADAYHLTNTMIADISQYVADFLTEMGYRAVPPTDVVFNREQILSNWSQRHIAYAAGVGTFGINNMLISEKGCCGRYGSAIANIPVEPDKVIEEERCLYKRNGSCKKCVQNCFSGALSTEGFDRKKCFEICLLNDAKTGQEVCGKCDIDIPCAFKAP